MNELRTSIDSKRRHRLVAAFAIIILVLAGIYFLGSWYSTEVAILDRGDSQQLGASIDGPVMGKSNPLRLSIPTLDLQTNFEAPVGLTEQDEIDVPDSYEDVAYYKFGPTPGELGPAVILGHVDSVDGPAVFYSLGKLEQGDRIHVDRADGTTATFEVTELERIAQSEFPTEKVYGNVNYAGLRLVTCTGDYDRGADRYSHNLIVYAKLVE